MNVRAALPIDLRESAPNLFEVTNRPVCAILTMFDGAATPPWKGGEQARGSKHT